MSRRILLVTAIFLLSLYCIGTGQDATAAVSILNRTRHYLHIQVNSQSFTFVAPGRVVRGSEFTGIIVMTATYSPGQGIRGTARRVADPPIVEVISDCSGNNDCESTSTVKNGAVYWEVLPDSMRVE